VVEVVDLQIIQVLNQVELAVVEMDLKMMHLDDNRQLLEVLTLEAVEVVELLVILLVHLQKQLQAVQVL
jgi:hypothetical protein